MFPSPPGQRLTAYPSHGIGSSKAPKCTICSRCYVAIGDTALFAAGAYTRLRAFGLIVAARRPGCAMCRVDPDNHIAGARSLVDKHRSDVTPRGVVNAFGLGCSRQTLDVETYRFR